MYMVEDVADGSGLVQISLRFDVVLGKWCWTYDSLCHFEGWILLTVASQEVVNLATN